MLRTQQIIVYHARKDLPIIKAKHETYDEENQAYLDDLNFDSKL